MPLPQESPVVESLEFNWGIKRGVGGKRKEVQFYESFTFDGDEYSLYDCVYLYHEGEPEPYIGKIIKIWEHPGSIRKIKILWFFRPIEVKNWLGDCEILDNEIFLASGEGVGLANINPLEALAGKCNVVCTSKDSRNPQPSEDEIRMADYVFFRTFDVGTCSISDKICDKIGGVEVKNIFNRSSQSTSQFQKLDELQKEENGKVRANDGMSLLTESCTTRSPEDVKTNENPGDAVRTQNGDLKTSLISQEPLGRGNLVHSTKAEIMETEAAAAAATKDSTSVGEMTLRRQASGYVKDEDKTGEVVEHMVVDERKLKSVKDDAQLDDRPLKKARLDTSVLSEKSKPSTSPTSPIIKDKSESSVPKKLGVGSNEVDDLTTEMNVIASEEKTKSRPSKDTLGKDKGSLKPAKCTESTAKLSNDSGVPKKLVGSDEVDVQATEMNGSVSEEKTKSRLKDSLKKDKGSLKLAKSTDKTANLSNGEHLKKTAANETDWKILEVTTRPNADRSKWFKGFPWEERMRTAYDQGTLVLLENLDPAYTSSEIEDIIWHSFGETCTARVVPRTATSSQHSGQAFVIFKSRDAADLAIRKLDEGCLMLPNGRPLIASKGVPPSVPGKQSFPGHIFIDQIKIQMQREEMRKAVSTSHCSQPNTIEYEMAMEWCLLRSRADSWWKELYKQQGDEMRKLRANLKLR